MFNQLAEFYEAYSDWIDAGAPESEPFSRRVGLCGSLCSYIASKGCRSQVRDMALQLMKSQFIKAGLSRDNPFNNADNSYYVECINWAIHTNKNRIAWVKREWKNYV
nr:MAG: hypothetical protein [Bacteriophage sp.]